VDTSTRSPVRHEPGNEVASDSVRIQMSAPVTCSYQVQCPPSSVVSHADDGSMPPTPDPGFRMSRPM
jgi:hypothetical protein